jgi:hypothetical protein
MLKVALATIDDKEVYCVGELCDQHILVTQPIHTFDGRFKSASRSTTGTSIVCEPIPRSSLLLTDLIVTTDRVALSTVTVRFTDGVNTENIITANTNDAPINFAIAFNGRWQGWKDARVELVTVNNVTVTAACGYMKMGVNHTLEYAEWTSER